MWAESAPPDVLPQLLDRGLQLGGGLPLQPGDHPDGDRQPEQVGGQLADRSLAEAIGPRQHAEDRPQPGAERPGGDARRQRGAGRGAAVRALQPMEPVLVHRRLDRRHLGDLVPQRPGIVAVEVVAAAAAGRRLALDHLPESFGRDQGSWVMAMAGLPAPLAARGGGRWPSLDRGRVGRGGLGGIGGVLAEPLLQARRSAARRTAPRPSPPPERRARAYPRWPVGAAADPSCRCCSDLRTQRQQWALNAYDSRWYEQHIPRRRILAASGALLQPVPARSGPGDTYFDPRANPPADEHDSGGLPAEWLIHDLLPDL